MTDGLSMGAGAGGPVSVAYARHFDTATAVARCAEAIGPDPLLLVVFCGGKHDPVLMLSELRARYGRAEISGGSAAGAMGFGGLGYSGLELGVLAFHDRAVTPRVLLAGDLLAGEELAGRELGAAVAAVATPDAVVLLLFDSVAGGEPPRLHYASSLVAGFEAGLAGHPVRLVGGGLLADINLSDGWVFAEGEVRKHVAVALVFPAGIAVDSVVLHGCRPVSTFMEITRIEGAEVFELDGEPALTVIERMLGLPLNDLPNSLTLVATLGQKQGDPFADYNENAYVNRLILHADRMKNSITLFEPDFRAGAKVQIMSRDNGLMLRSVEDGVAVANATIAAGRGLFNLYVDCAGRASIMSGAAFEEAEIVLRSLDRRVPFVGFYSGVEVAAFDGYSRPLDWTGLLLCVRQDAAAPTMLHREAGRHLG